MKIFLAVPLVRGIAGKFILATLLLSSSVEPALRSEATNGSLTSAFGNFIRHNDLHLRIIYAFFASDKAFILRKQKYSTQIMR